MDNLDKKPAPGMVRAYFDRVRVFKPNAWLYLLSVFAVALVIGVFRLLFNLYLDSLGYEEDLMGNLVTITSLVGLFLALPIGYVIDRWSRKWALVIRVLILVLSIGVMAIWPSVGIFYVMNGLIGIAMSMNAVIQGPFLMENSEEAERTYLFSFSSGLQNLAQFGGNFLGGYLPSWIGMYKGVDAEHSTAYGGALLVVAVAGLISLVPILMMKDRKKSASERAKFDPVGLIKEKPKLFAKMFTPLILVSIGAGLFVPFLNVYFKKVHGLPDQQIGALMAVGSLSMVFAFLIAPPLAERWGKLKFVVITQGLSIPFMIILGFIPFLWPAMFAYLVRMGLMNMSNPIYQNFVLDQVDVTEQATIASLYSMIWRLGRSFSPTVSGYLQRDYGFGPPFAMAIALYAIAISMYWYFFLRGGRQSRYEVVPALSK